MTRSTSLAAGLAICLVSAAAAQSLPAPMMVIPEASSNRGFDWGFSTGFDYVTNARCSVASRSVSCISTDTSAFSVPSSVMAQFDRVRVQVTVPFVDLEGPGHVSGVLGTQQVVGAPTGPVQRRYGLGDMSVGASVILLRTGDILPRVELGGIIKAPTGKDGLGTGKTDYGAQISLYRPLWPGTSLFGSGGYQWVGDTNTVELHKGARATAGFDTNYGIIGGGALLDYNQSLLAGLPNSFTVDPYVTLRVFGHVGLQAYTTIALTRQSPSREFGFRVVFGHRE